MTTPLDFINTHRGRRAQRPLDPVASGWSAADVEIEASRLGRPASCSTCLGKRRLIYRDGNGLEPLRPGEPTDITATPVDGPGFRPGQGWVVKPGDVTACPNCGD